MKVFRELELRGPEADVKATIEAIEGSLGDGWRRDLGVEGWLRSLAVGEEVTYCFSCDSRGERAAASLFLREDEAGMLRVTNILPAVAGRESGFANLSVDQYNAILEEFHDRFASPAASKTAAVVSMTPDEAGLEDWLGQDAIKALRRFSERANKSTGSVHPLDKERWFAFLLAAHEGDDTLDAETLVRWLVEDERWGEGVARDLGAEYEFGRALLKFAHAHAPSVNA